MSKPPRPEPTANTADVTHDAAYYERLVIGESARPRRRWGLMALAAVLLAGGSHAAARLAHRNDDLRLAVVSGDATQTRRLLMWGANPNLRAESVVNTSFFKTNGANMRKTLLMMAAFGGRESIVDMLLERGAAPNVQLANGQTALLYAANGRSPAVVHSLLAHGADVQARDHNGRVALLCAAQSGNVEILRDLLDHSASLEDTDAMHQSALCLACGEHHEDAIRLLLARGANVDSLALARWHPNETLEARSTTRPLSYQYQNPMLTREWTSIQWAAYNGSPSLIAAVWDTRLSPQTRGFVGSQALVDAVASGNVEAVRALLDRNVPAEPANSSNGRQDYVFSPLLMAAQMRNAALCQLLIERGAHVNPPAPTRFGTPLMMAAADTAPDTVRLLLAHGADVNAVDASGQTALMHSVNSAAVAQMLIERGASVNARDIHGQNAVGHTDNPDVLRVLFAHGADARGVSGDSLGRISRPEVLEMMLARGADVNARDSQGGTALTATWNDTLLPVLLKRGADINARDRQGRTALHTAVQRNSDKGIAMLLAYGANPDAADARGVTPRMMAQQTTYKPVHDAFGQTVAR